MVEQNLVKIGRSHRTEVTRKGRVDRSEDGETFGLTENKRQVRVDRFSGGDKSGQIIYFRDSRGDISRYGQGAGDDLERLK